MLAPVAVTVKECEPKAGARVAEEWRVARLVDAGPGIESPTNESLDPRVYRSVTPSCQRVSPRP